MRIWKIDTTPDLQRLIDETRHAGTLRIADDEGDLKVKSDEGTWSVGLGVLEVDKPETQRVVAAVEQVRGHIQHKHAADGFTVTIECWGLSEVDVRVAEVDFANGVKGVGHAGFSFMQSDAPWGLAICAQVERVVITDLYLNDGSELQNEYLILDSLLREALAPAAPRSSVDVRCTYCNEKPADAGYDRCYDCRTWRDEEWSKQHKVEHGTQMAQELAELLADPDYVAPTMSKGIRNTHTVDGDFQTCEVCQREVVRKDGEWVHKADFTAVCEPEHLYEKCRHCHLFVEPNPAFEDLPGLAEYIHLHRGDEVDERLDEDHEAAPSGRKANLLTWQTYGPLAMRERFTA